MTGVVIIPLTRVFGNEAMVVAGLLRAGLSL